MIDKEQYHKAIIVTGDGDFYCLVNYLIQGKKLSKLLIPNEFKYSALLKKIITFLILERLDCFNYPRNFGFDISSEEEFFVGVVAVPYLLGLICV